MSEPVIVMVVGTEGVDVVAARPDYREWNRLVGGPDGPGSISMCRLPSDLLVRGYRAYCDDDAIGRQQQPNKYATWLGHHVLRGPIVIFRDEEDGDEHSLTPEDIGFLIGYLASEPSAQAYTNALYDQLFWATHPGGVAMFELNDDLTIGQEIPPASQDS